MSPNTNHFVEEATCRCPKSYKTKKAIINVQNRDNESLRWALCTALFPPTNGKKVTRTSSYPTEDRLNFKGIDFPTPVSQINKLEKQNPKLAINVFGWEKDRVIVHRLSEREGSLPRINLMLIQNNEKSHYTYVRRLSALLHSQSEHVGVKHFCERCLRGYTTAELLERHKPECIGQLKRPTKTELPKEGKNKVKFKNHHKQMKVPFVVYADFESLIRKIHGCAKKGQATIKTEVHEPCGFLYLIVRSDGKTYGPFVYRGEDAVLVFLTWLQAHEMQLRAELARKKPLVITPKDWRRYKSAAECHICNESLVKPEFWTSSPWATPTQAVLQPKPQKMLLGRPPRKGVCGAAKRKNGARRARNVGSI